MTQNAWSPIDWRDPFWEVVRYYFSLRGKEQKSFRDDLAKADAEKDENWQKLLGLTPDTLRQLNLYLLHRESLLDSAIRRLRCESEAQEFCRTRGLEWEKTTTKNQSHHQSSKALIATVTHIAAKVCGGKKMTLEPNPQRRCIWAVDNHLHVSARNLDGAIPYLTNPNIVWEIKEYWGVTGGGSKMSDAVYECQLVGREIREFESRSKTKIRHYVFLDGKVQWLDRKSDLGRFIDLEQQGLIDRLFIGKDVENEWEKKLEEDLK